MSNTGWALPADFLAHGVKLKTYEFAADYIVLAQKELRERCANVQCPKAGLFAKHIPFGHGRDEETPRDNLDLTDGDRKGWCRPPRLRS